MVRDNRGDFRRNVTVTAAAVISVGCVVWCLAVRADSTERSRGVAPSSLAVTNLQVGSGTDPRLLSPKQISGTGLAGGEFLASGEQVSGPPFQPGNIDTEYENVIHRLSSSVLAESRADSWIRRSSLASESAVLKSARSAVSSLREQLEDKESDPGTKLNDAQKAILQLDSQLTSLKSYDRAQALSSSESRIIRKINQKIALETEHQQSEGQNTSKAGDRQALRPENVSFTDVVQAVVHATSKPRSSEVAPDQRDLKTSVVRKINQRISLEKQQHKPESFAQGVISSVMGQHHFQGNNSLNASSVVRKINQRISLEKQQHKPESFAQGVISSVMGQHHFQGNNSLNASDSLDTIYRKKLKSLTTTVRGINDRIAGSTRESPKAQDVTGVLKPTQPTASRSIVIHIHDNQQKTTKGAPGQLKQVATKSKVATATRTPLPAHMLASKHPQSTTENPGPGSAACGCCGGGNACSCCDQGWLGLQTFGKWLLMVLALVLCVMTFLIFGFMCFGCLWAWREFKRQDRWERFLDKTTGKDGKSEEKAGGDTNVGAGGRGQAGSRTGNAPGAPAGAPPSSQGLGSGRGISTRGDASMAR
eukprot:CAMPEP_0181308060 /NCGR_PEP_ID=MMETSP1101-20121128/11239_1 /TAXON_ID=46948 /ORGANISM="Rhodomonas abbreviata, Strain Caron Lab Isolate" /LENGTH=591 /DNA_ID=CAMNT_0023414373 /DNA_START=286 /DNA_END=2061 /DNA_ORIENTATION=+